MGTAFLALVNYGTAGLLLAYNVQAFLCMRKREQGRKKSLAVVMKAEIALIFALCFFTLYLRSGEGRYLLFFGIQLVIYSILDYVYERLYPKMSGLLFDHMMLLLCVGSVLLARLDFSGAIRQFVIVAVALVAALFIPAFIRAMHRIERYGYVYLAGGIAILLLVFFFAGERLGARIWVKLFGVAMQPFEFVKILFIFGCAAVLLRAKSWKGTLAGMALAGVHILLMAASNDLGGALLFAVVFWILLYCSDGKKRWIFGGLAAAGGACVAAYYLFSHVQVRVLAWKDPFAVVDNEGYQLAQSLFAIGNGGFFGTGLLKGAPEQIPVVTTDYIFSAACEELGALFALGLLGIYVQCMILLIRMAERFSEDYYRLVFTGFAAMFTTQVLLNVGGVTRMLPSTGVPLPFVSAGGSSAASMVLMFMLIQGMQEQSGAQAVAKRYKDGFVPGVLTEKARGALRRCLLVFPAILLVVALYFTVFICTEARTVIFNSYNRRQAKLEEQNARGAIFDTDGKPLAFTMLSEEEEVRKYPYGRLYAHVVGQVNNGSSGLEAVKEIDLLSASTGELSKLLYRMKDAQIPGNNLFTTLRTDLQEKVYETLSGYSGAACVTEVSTGALLASVSLPDFEPENPAGPGKEEENGPYFNRVFYGEYPVADAIEWFRTAAVSYEGKVPTPFGETVVTDGTVLTPYGAAVFAGACGTGGVYKTPHVVRKLTDASGKEIYRTETETYRLLNTEEAKRCYERMSVKETVDGLAYRYVETEVASGTSGKKHCLAAALFPAENPKVAVCVVFEFQNGAGDGRLQTATEQILQGLTLPE
ncbi:MAG: FtsW/RodA/SpoVE family cell cycle protein [Lachnospiraceae bacterium]|nr:FtsW/RodA/SpoVE family cell cycle protein [Lachnospiraceae bacterium]